MDVVRALNTAGLLAPQIPTGYGGAGWSSLDSGEFTAQVGSLCSSLRSVMTSQAMAAWTIERLADRAQARSLLPRLAATDTAAVAFSEPQAGSDLSAMTTTVTMTGDTLRLDGHKVWVTAADHADLLLVFARLGDQGAVGGGAPGHPGGTGAPAGGSPGMPGGRTRRRVVRRGTAAHQQPARCRRAVIVPAGDNGVELRPDVGRLGVRGDPAGLPDGGRRTRRFPPPVRPPAGPTPARRPAPGRPVGRRAGGHPGL